MFYYGFANFEGCSTEKLHTAYGDEPPGKEINNLIQKPILPTGIKPPLEPTSMHWPSKVQALLWAQQRPHLEPDQAIVEGNLYGGVATGHSRAMHRTQKHAFFFGPTVPPSML
jgi:hypothetical protein